MNSLFIALPLVGVVIIAILLTLLTVVIAVRCRKYLRKGATNDNVMETTNQATLNQSTNCSDHEVVNREPNNIEIDDDISVNTTANVAYITPQSTAVCMTINMAYGYRTTTN